MHTPPLPKLPNTEPTKTATGNANLSAQRVSNFQLHPSLSRQQLTFLQKVTPPALAQQRLYGIPAAVTIAQAILESATPRCGWGSSLLFRQANNPFGIKYAHFGESGHPATDGAHVPDAASQAPAQDYGCFYAPTWEVVNGRRKPARAEFQRFPNLDEAFAAHAQLLRAPRYRPAFEARHDWKKFAALLGPKNAENPSGCGYSTNPGYAASLTQLVNEHRLDDPRALAAYAAGGQSSVISSQSSVGGSQSPAEADL